MGEPWDSLLDLVDGLGGVAVGGALGLAGGWLTTGRSIKAAKKEAQRQAIGAALSKLVGACDELTSFASWVDEAGRQADRDWQKQLSSAVPGALGRISESNAALQRLAPPEIVTHSKTVLTATSTLVGCIFDDSASGPKRRAAVSEASKVATNRLIEAARRLEGLAPLPKQALRPHPPSLDDDPPSPAGGRETAS